MNSTKDISSVDELSKLAAAKSQTFEVRKLDSIVEACWRQPFIFGPVSKRRTHISCTKAHGAVLPVKLFPVPSCTATNTIYAHPPFRVRPYYLGLSLHDVPTRAYARRHSHRRYLPLLPLKSEIQRVSNSCMVLRHCQPRHFEKFWMLYG